MSMELPLPEFASLERVRIVKPIYRVNLQVEVEYESDVQFSTDGDPRDFLDDEKHMDELIEDLVHWQNESSWGPDVRHMGDIEVSYDDGTSWQKWVPDDE